MEAHGGAVEAADYAFAVALPAIPILVSGGSGDGDKKDDENARDTCPVRLRASGAL